MRYILVKIDRSSDKEQYVHALRDGHGTVNELTRRRWRLEEGSRLLLASGSGAHLTFLAQALVTTSRTERLAETERQTRENEDQYRYKTTIKLTEVTAVERATFEDLVYSLRRVWNFSQPWRHLPNRASLGREDFETIVNHRVHRARSAYFGLLRHLPTELRNRLEAESRLQALLQGENSPHPLAQLISRLMRLAVVPAELACEIMTKFENTFDVTRGVWGGDELDIRRLARQGEAATELRAGLRAIEGSADQISEKRGDLWPQHRW